jgi:tetratricopeptide (TPR) repeat protein/mono/diheme cytochrome c family protein
MMGAFAASHFCGTGPRVKPIAARLAVLVAALGVAQGTVSHRTRAAQRPAGGKEPQLTFYRDIAPIIDAHCASCHRPDGAAPFSLLSYRDVMQRTTSIGSVTSRRIMPPWKPEHAKGEFVGERVITDGQIALIQDWIAQGTAEGVPEDRPPVPQLAPGWQLGTPDIVVTMAEPYILRPGGADAFRTFVIPIPLSTPRYVKALEFKPGNPRVVHHANVGIDRTRSSRYLDRRDPEPGYAGGMLPEAGYPEGYLLGYTPGQVPHAEPDGMAWRLDTGSDLVVQLHMQPSGKPEPVRVSVGFYFTDEPPLRTPVGLRLGSETIDIPANERDYVIRDSYVLPADVEVLAVQPHAHYLCRRMDAVARLPDGAIRPLISIGDWDFRWQDVYRYVRPVTLPRGTVISMRYSYDNSSENPRNPGRPPGRVPWGPGTTEEMGDLWLQVVPRANGDLALLKNDIARKMRRDDLAASTKLLHDDPSNPLRHDAVALLQLQGGQVDDAIVHYRQSLQLNPASARVHYNLAEALLARGRLDDALAEFLEAIRLNPDHAEAHNNAGAVLLSFGRRDEAFEHLRRAIELNPEDAGVHNNLARALMREGRIADAIQHFREALQLRPDWPPALSGLAWIEATSVQAAFSNPEEAIRVAERARTLTGGADALVLDTLAAAYAATGRFDRAIAIARAGLQLAAPSTPAFASEIRQRLDLYERHLPYRE